MIAYEIYKIIHLVSLALLLTGFALQFCGITSRGWKILTGVTTLLVLVSGMGLLARVGIQHAEPWPTWVRTKMMVWLVVGVGGAVIAKRFPQHGKLAYVAMMLLFALAASMAIYKF